MKRGDFIKLLEQSGLVFFRHGSCHDIYQHVKTGKRLTVPRHSEIGNELVKKILKQSKQPD